MSTNKKEAVSAYQNESQNKTRHRTRRWQKKLKKTERVSCSRSLSPFSVSCASSICCLRGGGSIMRDHAICCAKRTLVVTTAKDSVYSLSFLIFLCFICSYFCHIYGHIEARTPLRCWPPHCMESEVFFFLIFGGRGLQSQSNRLVVLSFVAIIGWKVGYTYQHGGVKDFSLNI